MMEISRAVERFRREGYYRVPERIDEVVIESARVIVRNEFSNPVRPYRVNESGHVARIDHILDRDPIFLAMLRSPAVMRYLSALLGEHPVVAKHRHNHATLNRESDIPVRLHRDIQQWTRSIVSVLIYLEDSTAANGATILVPGSQFNAYPGPQSGDGGGTWMDEHQSFDELIGQEVMVEMPAGGILLLDSLCFHSVGPNSSHSSRMSVTFAAHSGDSLASSWNADDVIPLRGPAPFKGNSVLPVSGSLADPAIELRADA